jgi:GMP synthase-like glutamine amidotransferase
MNIAMKRVIVLQHMDREGPGYIADLCRARGLRVIIVRLDEGATVPSNLGPGDVLVVMGGSMGVGDIGDPRYPFLADEAELLRSALANKRPVLGICLGAQLLAHAAGSRVYPNQRPGADQETPPQREVGFGEVTLLRQDSEAALAGLPPKIPVLHWHGDTYDLPPGAVHLAKSNLCMQQAFRIGQHAFGLQFHVETNAQLVCRWAEDDADFAKSALGPDGPAQILAQAHEGAQRVCESGRLLISNILDQMLGKTG